MAINKSVALYMYMVISVCYLGWVSTSNVFQVISCPGEVLTIECAIMGGGTTVWQGTAFQCDHNNGGFIALRHSQFRGLHKPIGTCNNGAIIAQAIGVVNSSYISQVNVTVSPELNNTTVECTHDYNLTVTVVKSTNILLPIGRQKLWKGVCR